MVVVPIKHVLLWLPRVLAPATGFVMLPFAVPALNSLEPQQIDLTGSFALTMYWIAESGGKFGIPLILSALILVVVIRSGITWRERCAEAGLIVLVIALLLGGGAWLNEHVVKPSLAVPRPNLVELSRAKDGALTLGMPVEQFYAMPDKAQRSAYLERVLRSDQQLDARIREHWVSETGYSFPSGHSYSAMLFATFFLAVARRRLSGRRLWLFSLLSLWAVAVCLSRTILRVHSPTDILVGALEGMLVGVLAFLLLEGLRRWLLPEPPATEDVVENNPGPRRIEPLS